MLILKTGYEIYIKIRRGLQQVISRVNDIVWSPFYSLLHHVVIMVLHKPTGIFAINGLNIGYIHMVKRKEIYAWKGMIERKNNNAVVE